MILDLSNIDDGILLNNFKEIEKEFKSSPILSGKWQLIEREFKQSGYHKIYHKLKFKPIDVIHLSTIGNLDVQYVYENFTNEFIEINLIGAGSVKIRFLVGKCG